MKAYIFPGQGTQYPGMGKKLYENPKAKNIFKKANKILGFYITDIMFEGSSEDLKKTNIAQLAIYIYSIAKIETLNDFNPNMVAGHSLGEFSALVASGSLNFEEGLQLISQRATAMREACKLKPSGMAVILGLKDQIVEEICKEINGIVVPANYNCPEQIVISGEKKALEKACEAIKIKKPKKIIILNVDGAFHSPLMNKAQKKLTLAIKKSYIKKPYCPIYQNVNGERSKDPNIIKKYLIKQLNMPVKWHQSIKKMINDGANIFIEIGPGKVLQGLIKKINSNVKVYSAK